MTVVDVRKDPQALTMTIDAEFDASPERVWQLWADPRQLERWWGPPTYPATFTTHDLAPGSHVEFEIKRAGKKSGPVLGVVYEREGHTVAPPHRLP